MTYNKVSKWRIVLDSVKLIMPLMAYLIGLIAFLSWLPNRNVFTVTLTIIIGSMIFKLVGEIKAHKTPVLLDYVKSVGVTILYVVGFWFLIMWLGAYGFVGTIIIVLVYAGFRLLRNRKGYLDAMRTVETMVFGKTLDKKNKEVKK